MSTTDTEHYRGSVPSDPTGGRLNGYPCAGEDPRPSTYRLHEVVVVAQTSVLPFDVAAARQVLSPDLPGRRRYRVRVCGERIGPTTTADSYAIHVEYGLRLMREADTVVVAGVADPHTETCPATLKALQESAARGARIVGIGSGVFTLARAGLLSGRRVTTHWRYTDMLNRMYPTLRVDRGALFVQDENVFTSAGFAAAIDLYVELVRQDHGVEVANLSARHTVIGAPRNGSQAQFIERPLPPRDKAGLADIRAWILAHLDEPMTVDALAARAYVSRRHFTRVFRAETGTSVWQWLVEQRLRESRRLLESTDESVERIGELCGFPTPAAFRMHFRRATDTTPSAYRMQARAAVPLAHAS